MGDRTVDGVVRTGDPDSGDETIHCGKMERRCAQ